MEVGVGPARYEDLNSDLPVCITQDFLLIQTVTGLVGAFFSCAIYYGYTLAAAHCHGMIRSESA